MAVKRSIGYERKFSHVRLHREDLDQIEAALAKLPDEPGDDQGAIFETEAWQASSLDELREVEGPSPLTELSIADRNIAPRVRVNLYSFGTYLRGSGIDDPVTRGVLEEVADVLAQARAPWPLRVLGHPVVDGAITAVSLILATAAIVGLFGRRTDLVVFAGVPAIALGLVTGMISLGPLRHGPTIALEKREARPSFWQRNRDEILVGAVTAVVTAVVTALVTQAWL